MKKFQFNLEAVLKVRDEKVKAAQREVKEVLQRLDEVKERIRQVQEERLDVEAGIKGGQTSSTTASELHDKFLYLESLQKTLAGLQEDTMRINNELHAKRVAVGEAKKEKEVLEKLKEKRWTEWNQMVVKKERQFLDEVATIRHQSPKLE